MARELWEGFRSFRALDEWEPRFFKVEVSDQCKS
jgi:hypothetical protein